MASTPWTAQRMIFSLSQKNGVIQIKSTTKGASIAYILSNESNLELDYNSNWKLYSTPIKAAQNTNIYTIAERIGYKESDIVKHQIK